MNEEMILDVSEEVELLLGSKSMVMSQAALQGWNPHDLGTQRHPVSVKHQGIKEG